MKEKTLSTDHGIIHYWTSDDLIKDRLTLFFLHGLTAGHDLFTKQLEHFSGRYNLLAWDAPSQSNALQRSVPGKT